MSPLSLRRYRAERLLRDEFDGLRGRVLASVRGRLRASGVTLDQDDLEACYAQAWQGLYAAMLEGQEIANPAGWLVLVTFRRAIEEHRSRARAQRGGDLAQDSGERDLAAELDDRDRLRQLFEGLRGRLDGREREAAALCYLQGLSRSQAAVRMGVSEARMRKLMEGHGHRRPGVAGKVGALVQTIRDGGWCDEQGSLMRALAYGVLDPDGERYQLALMHSSQCPACRSYVASLRGLAAALPAVLWPWSLSAAALAGVGEAAHASGASGGLGTTGAGGTAAPAPGAAATGAGLPPGQGLGGAVSASGALGAGGAAGGGWLVGAGPLGAKLAVGCLLALGVGAGCVAFDGGRLVPARRHRHDSGASAAGGEDADAFASGRGRLAADGAGDASAAAATATAAHAGTAALTPAARATREFGPEQALASVTRSGAPGAGGAPSAQSASSRSDRPALRTSANDQSSAAADGRSSSAAAGASSGVQSTAPAPAGDTSGDSPAAEREFAPG
jgi:DNA-directed RNA polymerase specialized sigma24 family protein